MRKRDMTSKFFPLFLFTFPASTGSLLQPHSSADDCVSMLMVVHTMSSSIIDLLHSTRNKNGRMESLISRYKMNWEITRYKNG